MPAILNAFTLMPQSGRSAIRFGEVSGDAETGSGYASSQVSVSRRRRFISHQAVSHQPLAISPSARSQLAAPEAVKPNESIDPSLILQKPGLDGRDRGAKVIPGRCGTPAWNHLRWPAAVARADRERRSAGGCRGNGAVDPLRRAHESAPRYGADSREAASDVMVVMGATFRRRHPEVECHGSQEACFSPGTPMQRIVDFINGNTQSRVEQA